MINHRIVILFFALLLILSNSTGFDMYSHSTMYYFYDEQIGKYYSFFDFIVIPRYFLLSYIYEFTSRIGIPLGYIFIMLALYPLNVILKYVLLNSQNNYIQLQDFIVITISYILFFFYSGLSLSLLWAIAYFLTTKKRFLIGAFFHPVGIVLYIIIVVFSGLSKLKNLLYAILIFILFLIVDTHIIEFFYCGDYNNANFNMMDDLFSKLMKVQTKKTEILFLLFVLISYLFLKKLKYKLLLSVNILMVILVCFSLVIVIYMFPKNTLLNYVYIKQSINNYAIYNTWFDFGKRDDVISFQEMRRSRYENY